MTVVSAVIDSAHVGVAPAQPPDQPINNELASDAAVSVTEVFTVNGATHVAPQSIPGGALLTVPAPVPALATVRLYWGALNAAVTTVGAVLSLSVKTHVPVPEQPPPDHPTNVMPESGVAVRVTTLPNV